MQFQYYLDVLVANIRGTSLLEWIAVLSAVAQVLLARANKLSNYLFGVLSTAVYIYIYANSKLYAESTLNFYYLIMSVYGLWHWRADWLKPTGTTEVAHMKPVTNEVTVTFSNTKEWAIAAAIAAGGFVLGSFVLDRFTNSPVPMWDAGVSAFAWAGMWLLARRKVENWLWLNTSNALALPLLFFRGLVMTSVLTVFLFVVAVAGFFAWRRMALRAQASRHEAAAHRF